MCVFLSIISLFCFMISRTEPSENIAFGKPTNQSSIFPRGNGHLWTSDKVVDNDTRNNHDLRYNTCMHTDVDSTITEVWWYVDLGRRSRISQVRIVYRQGYTARLAGFSLFVSDEMFFSDDNPVLCHKDTSSLSLPKVDDTVRCNATGRFVTVYNERIPGATYPDKYSEKAIMELCEVFIYGCPIGRFGEGNCNSNCSVGCKDSDCYPDSGICVQGCQLQWMGPNCDACVPGLYGKFCEKNCSVGCNGKCDRIDATCSCKERWTGGTCTRCSAGYYGESCEHDCSYGCQNNTCIKDNGRCSPCKVEWTDPKCDVCANGYYGHLCQHSCSIGCSQACNKIDGTCGCKTEWSGNMCDVCADGFFGEKCKHSCSVGCNETPCDKTDGGCECTERWMGHTCRECIDELYGKSCENNCSIGCLNRTCHKESGSCSGMCKANWTGQNCDICEDGLFGTSCELNCSIGCQMSCNKIDGACECKTEWDGKTCEVRKEVKGQNDEASNVPSIVGPIVAVMALLAIGIGSCIFIRRRQRKQNERDTEHVNEDKTHENKQFSSACVTESEDEIDKTDGNVYENMNIVLKYVMPIDKIREQVHKKREQAILEEEFNDLPYGATHAHLVAEKEENVNRNRYKATLPYDHSRVILHDAKTDYINANYITLESVAGQFLTDWGVHAQRKYIATQGPKSTTTEDFWQMVWQEQSCMIVMLTNIFEGGKKKCEKYWPDHLKSLTFSTLDIKLQDEMTYSFYTKRTFVVTKKEIKKQLIVTQMHFTTWPDHGVPDPLELMLFHRRFQALQLHTHGLPIVHCSAGIGRTGTFIALDAMVELAKGTDEINVFDFVKSMRLDRMNMIQTKEQYVVLHDALVEALDFIDTNITKEMFSNVWTESKSDKPINQSRIRKEFQSLHSQRPKYSSALHCKSALLEKNRDKNRSLEILALDKYRVYITPRTSDGMNYINAITLPSYRKRNDIIVTQDPLQNTEKDFWVMVKEQRSNVIVCLDITLEQVQVKGLNIFTVSDWHVGKLPADKTELVKVIEKVKCAIDVDESGPITVVCRDGATCCGLFCIIYNSIQRLQVDGDVDIYQTAKQLLARRPEFCQTFEQYQFCYDAVMEYVNTTDIYSN